MMTRRASFQGMRYLYSIVMLLSLVAGFGCGGDKPPASPRQTLMTYAKALKQKDTTTMKLLLSAESIKMMEQEAKSQGVNLDDVVKRETLFSETQRTGEFRNEKIDGQRATLEVKNISGEWEIVPFVFEEDQWKIDKKAYSDRLIQEIQQQQDAVFGAGEPTPVTDVPVSPNP